jgi:DMSO/TMAO reductase YedYZ heme-binding membrane subunit
VPVSDRTGRILILLGILAFVILSILVVRAFRPS